MLWLVIFFLIKSPWSGLILCFQFVSAVSVASADAKALASLVKTVCAKPYISGKKNIWVWENVMHDFSMTLPKVTAVTLINKNLLVCTVCQTVHIWDKEYMGLGKCAG